MKVILEGVEGFILKCKNYEKEIKLLKNEGIQEDKDRNIFISYDTNDAAATVNSFVITAKPFYLEDADKEFSVKEGIRNLINNIFNSGTICIFGVDYKGTDGTITAVRKCD
ncbi:hypothetical protein [Clostridium sp. JN-9]|uniref:hypothetical protein n=1 Tax=Clostridium sp. JN-9 TaxID=2507159 RepID=UPI000FFE301C|nr:hypothetical protein [Clostridium sp. JN-9]QAT40534.1 hypothetical protein EQM05_09810 [Clostridium sp. JN-9]